MKEPVSLLAAASSEGRLTPPRDRHSDPTLNGALAEEHSRSTILARHPGTVKSRRWHVLPDVCAGDPERLARFEPEAKLLASLDHPSITSIHGLEEANEKRCLVLELVEGQTLANRLRKGALIGTFLTRLDRNRSPYWTRRHRLRHPNCAHAPRGKSGGNASEKPGALPRENREAGTDFFV